MARLALQLPDTLHRQLTFRARREGVSLNQYLVYLLAQRLAPAGADGVSPRDDQGRPSSFSASKSSE
ncbi:MAG TPA: toxin-antitoxin system HicB family antitoxin [Thermoanaerobaculia bacterium]